MAGYLLDTGIVIRHLRGRKQVVQLVRTLGQTERLSIATMTRVEVVVGMHEDERYATRRLLMRFINLPLDPAIADRAGELVRRTKNSEQPLGVPDAIIAATALIHSLTLVTLNLRDFASLPALPLYPIDF